MGREARNRQPGILESIDSNSRRSPCQTVRQLVKVYSGGSFPTAVPRVFLTHPVVVDVDDTERAVPLFEVDTTTTIPVIVLGPSIPSVGDLINAHAICGRWFAERGVGGGTAAPCVNCSVCDGVEIDSISANYEGPGGTGTVALYSGGFPVPSGWNSIPFPLSAGSQCAYVSISCTSDKKIHASVTYVLLYDSVGKCYNYSTCSSSPANSYLGSGKTIDVDCSDPNQIVAVFDDLVFPLACVGNPPPITQVTATLTLRPARAQVCCAPCAIPKKNLTLTIGAETRTLVYSESTQRWTDGTYTLGCFGGQATLIGGRSWTLASGLWVCRPFHAVFTSSTLIAYIDE